MNESKIDQLNFLLIPIFEEQFSWGLLKCHKIKWDGNVENNSTGIWQKVIMVMFYQFYYDEINFRCHARFY